MDPADAQHLVFTGKLFPLEDENRPGGGSADAAQEAVALATGPSAPGAPAEVPMIRGVLGKLVTLLWIFAFFILLEIYLSDNCGRVLPALTSWCAPGGVPR
jgi:hypothetical protein